MASNSTLHSGVLHKCGGKVKSWTRRWMVLRSDLSLSYYKDAAKPPLGVISLKDPSISVRIGQKADCNWPKNSKLERSLVLTTTKRRFYLFAESLEEAEEWLSHLQAAVAQATSQQPTSSNTVPSRQTQPIPGLQVPSSNSPRPASASLASSDSPIDIRKAMASELPLPETVPNRFVPKQYQPKFRRQVTGRYNDDSDISGVESGGDDDSDAVLNSGELDRDEFNRKHPVVESFEQSFVLNKIDSQVCSPSMHEALYDVARLPEEVTPSDKPPSNSNNNNGDQEPKDDYEPMDKAHTLRPAVADSSTNIHESLYDLVGKINAGEMDDLPMQNGAHSRTQSLIVSPVNCRNNSSSSGFSVASQPPFQQDFYEPIQEQVNGSVTNSVRNQPLPPVPQATVTERLPLRNLSSPPGDVYEPIGSISPPPLNLYEEVEKSSRVQEALSSDDESCHHQLSAAGPALPPKSNPGLPSCGDGEAAPPPPALPRRNDGSLQTEYGNAPPLPSKETIFSSKPPMRPPLLAVDGNPSLSNVSHAMHNAVAGSSPDNGHMEGDIYDDATSVSAPSVQTAVAAVNQEDIYDDAISVATSSNYELSPLPSSSSQAALPKVQQLLPSDSVAQPADHLLQSAERKFQPVEENGQVSAEPGGSFSPGRVKPCPLPRRKRANSRGTGLPETVVQNPSVSDSSIYTAERSSVPTSQCSTAANSLTSSNSSTSSLDMGKGMALFHRRSREISEVEKSDEPKKRVVSMLLTGGEGQDMNMSAIAETLREIEHEKQMASEERFRFERERKRLAEEKKEMEKEKERLREELERTRALLNANK